jgi:hypothetical protein
MSASLRNDITATSAARRRRRPYWSDLPEALAASDLVELVLGKFAGLRRSRPLLGFLRLG